MFYFLKELFDSKFSTKEDTEDYQEQIKEAERKQDCCILGYHKWIYVVKGRKKVFRICDVCGKIEYKTCGFEGIVFWEELKDEVKKKALLNCIKYDRKKKIYRLICE